FDGEGRTDDATAIAERMRAIDPAVEPRAAARNVRKGKSADLVFLDLDAPSQTLGGSDTPPHAPRMPSPSAVNSVEQDIHLVLSETARDPEIEQIIVRGPQL